MLNIAVVEDDAEDAKKVKECLEYMKKTDGIDYDAVEFNDPVKFIFRESFEFDLIFLDIQMPSMDGMEVAKAIRERNKTVGIVFITNMYQLAIKGYEVEALDFIVKPVNINDFYLKMKHILARMQLNKKDKIIIGTRNNQVAFPVRSILYIDVSGHYVRYHTQNNTAEEYATLKEIEKKLAPYKCFARCNRYYLVNLNHVNKIVGDTVDVGGVNLSISRSLKTDFCTKVVNFVSGGGN